MGTFHLTADLTIAQQMVQYCLQWLPSELNVGARPSSWDIECVDSTASHHFQTFRVVVKLSNGVEVRSVCELTRDRASYKAARCSLVVDAKGKPPTRWNLELDLRDDKLAVMASSSFPAAATNS